MKTRTIFALGIAAVAVALAPVAHAEPGVGDIVCSQSKLGVPADQIAGQLHQGDPRYSEWDTSQTVWTDLQDCQ